MDVSIPVLVGQVFIGLINGGFYALLSLGLALVFGLLRIVNFAHGAMYMLGAFVAWMLLNYFGIGYWAALVIAPPIVGLFGIVLERFLIRRIYNLHHIYGLLLTFGMVLIIEGAFTQNYGTAGQPYAIPDALRGGVEFWQIYMPNYRIWVLVASLLGCGACWYVVEKTKIGSYLRAGTENPDQVRAFGFNVPRMIMLTFGAGCALAAFGGVLAAPVYQVSPIMGSSIIIIVFAVVVIGGMGSIKGAVASGFMLGFLEGLAKAIVPELSGVVFFLVMILVLMFKPAGLFGSKEGTYVGDVPLAPREGAFDKGSKFIGQALLALALIVPFLDIYTGFFMKAMTFALFASAYNLSLGYGAVFSFGHAGFFGAGVYAAAYALKFWGFTPELAILLGGAVGALLGLGYGFIALRRQGFYFAMVTMGLAQMIFYFIEHSPYFGGEDGLRGIPSGLLFGLFDMNNTMVLYFFVFAVTLLGLGVIHRVIHSPLGNVMKAVRENQPRAVSLGYSPERTKMIALTISATLSGVAGSMKVLFLPIASLSDVHWSMSGEPILMSLVGGIGTFLGPVIGATTMVMIEGYLAELGAWYKVVQGGIFIVCILAFRRGIVGVLAGGISCGPVADWCHRCRKRARKTFMAKQQA